MSCFYLEIGISIFPAFTQYFENPYDIAQGYHNQYPATLAVDYLPINSVRICCSRNSPV